MRTFFDPYRRCPIPAGRKTHGGNLQVGCFVYRRINNQTRGYFCTMFSKNFDYHLNGTRQNSLPFAVLHQCTPLNVSINVY